MGKLAEVYSQHDVIGHGFSIIYIGRVGCDYFAIKPTIGWFVEVKYGKSRLSKKQQIFKNFCKKAGLNYFVYRVSPSQLENWLIERSGM